MHQPEMILFDYGYTLLYEPEIDFLKGEQEVFRHVVNNPYNITPEKACETGQKIFEQYGDARKKGFEIHEWQMLRFKYEYLGIELDISYEEAEKILWDAAAVDLCMPQVQEMLDYMADRGIRSGVISNLGWSGGALAERIHGLLPNNRFEFIMTSSEYGFRKPNKLLFELALRKAGLEPDKVWYCGDSIGADVLGAYNAGIFPVLYEEKQIENPWKTQNTAIHIEFEYLHIHHWKEMIAVLEAL